MIDPGRLYELFKKNDIHFYSGVPDSLMKDFLKCLQDHSAESKHFITANEGLAIALASGYHFQSGKLPLVYLQNSGLGNIINPLTSLADKEMYAVPMLLMIGWRGRPGITDEPQHKKMGRITSSLLEILEVPYYILQEDEEQSFRLIKEAIGKAINLSSPVALLVPENLFTVYNGVSEKDNYSLNREEVIKKTIGQLAGHEAVICTTGKTGREFYEQNKLAGDKISRYLLSVGAMGHAGHIALGIATGNDKETIVLLDGDGSVLMHMGGLSAISQLTKGNFLHIVLNNGCHESVGGQPTAAFSVDLCQIAAACGYPNTICIDSEENLDKWLDTIKSLKGVHFVEIRISHSSRENLGRPSGDPVAWKKDFMNALKKNRN